MMVDVQSATKHKSLICVTTSMIYTARLLWPATQYPVAHLLHWYLHRSRSDCVFDAAPLFPWCTHAGTVTSSYAGTPW